MNIKTAVTYARFSSDNQREESITAQLRAIREYAARNGIQIIREYTDEARSATTDDRPGFLQMIRDLKDGLRVDLVLVHKLDRFARNRYDAAVYRREIQRAGARLVAVDQPLDDSPEGAFLEGILEAMNEYYSRNLAREVMKGMKENAYQARFNGGWVPLGYKVVDGKYEVNEVEAEAVRLIFGMVRDGRSFREVARELEARGYRSRRGKPFSISAIHEILRNPKYVGVYRYNRAPRRIDGKRNWRRAKSEEEIITIAGAIPAIIDRTTWEEVQRILDSRKWEGGPRRRGPNFYILTGKLVCGLCGTPCVGHSRGRDRKTRGMYHYYECNAKMRGECLSKSWRKEELEARVLGDVANRVFADLPVLADQIYAYYLERRWEKGSEAESLLAALNEVTQRMDRLLDLVESGQADPAVAGPRLNRLQAQKQDLEGRLAAVRKEMPQYTKEMILAYLEHVKGHLTGELGPHEARKFVESYVKKITLYPDRAEVEFQLALDGKHSVGVRGATFTYAYTLFRFETDLPQ